MHDPDLLPPSTLSAASNTTAHAPLFPPDEDRQVLIVIPTVGTPSVLLPCFAKLLQYLDGIPVHICVSLNPKDQEHGDECAEEVVELWSRAARKHRLPPRSVLTIYRHPAPCGFGGALNRGIMAAAGVDIDENPGPWCDTFPSFPDEQDAVTISRYTDIGNATRAPVAGFGLPELTVFYNDDLEAAPGWLAELLSGMRSETVSDITEPAEPNSERRRKRPMAAYGRVGMIGPCTNNAAGHQRIGGEEAKAWSELGTLTYASQWRAKNSGYVLTADFLSGFCLGITRDCLLDLWGANEAHDGPALFDEANYPIAGYEDNDLCVRAAQAGYRCVIAAGSFVGHIGHQTFDAMFPDARRGMRNRLSFYKKWAPWVRSASTASKPLVAALRVKIEVPHDLRLLRATLGRLGELVDGAAVLFTGPPEVALSCDEGRAELAARSIAKPDLDLLRVLAQTPEKAARSKLVLRWVKEALAAGAEGKGRVHPSAVVAWWTAPFNERDERNFLLQCAESVRIEGVAAGWIWSMDHDEIVEPRITRALIDRWTCHPDPMVSQFDQGFYTPWTDDHRLYRTDKPWGDGGLMKGGMRGWRLFRVNRAAPGRIVAGTDNGLHCGNIPTSDGMAKRCAAIRILHLGYSRLADRRRKYERYRRQDPTPDKLLVGGSNYEHLINEDVVTQSEFNQRNGIGLHMLCHEGEDLNGVMQHLDTLHTMLDEVALVWTSPSTDSDAHEAFCEVAGLFGAQIVHHPIDPATGGMADARNAGIDALQAAARDDNPTGHGLGWALFFDPDELPPQESPPMIRRMADAVDIWCWLFTFINGYRDGNQTVSESIRMTRLQPVMRMDGRVHEGFGLAIGALRGAGYNAIMRPAPFATHNLGLQLGPDAIQAKYDRYFRWALSGLQSGSRRAVDWCTLGLYFCNEGLIKAPELCFAHAMDIDPGTYLPAQELASHYQRLSRVAYREAVRRLDGHPRGHGYMRLVKVSEDIAPDVAGSGTVGRPGHAVWTDEQAVALVEMVLAMEAHAATATPETAPETTQGPTQETASTPAYLPGQEDDGDAA